MHINCDAVLVEHLSVQLLSQSSNSLVQFAGLA